MERQQPKLFGWHEATGGAPHPPDSSQNRMGAIEHYYCQISLFAFIMGINDDEELGRPRESIKRACGKVHARTHTLAHPSRLIGAQS